MDTPFFSIVIPVFNAEPYLAKAVDSIRNQTFRDWQLILVEDHSTDKSFEICSNYTSLDERIQMVHQEENQGANVARQCGVREAAGQYVSFMDADDYVGPEMLYYVYQVLQRNEAKLTVMGVTEEYYDLEGKVVDRKVILPVSEESNALTYANESGGMAVQFVKHREELHRQILYLEQKTLYGYLWNKFYDRDYLAQHGFQFENIPLLEDARFNIEYAMEIDTMNLVNIAEYHYCKRKQDSLTKRVKTDYFSIHQKHIKMLLAQQVEWGSCDQQARKILGDIYVRYISSALERNCRKENGMDHGARVQWVEALWNDELYEELLAYTEGEGKLGVLVLSPLKAHSSWRTLFAGRVIHLIRSKMPGLFAKLRK